MNINKLNNKIKKYQIFCGKSTNFGVICVTTILGKITQKNVYSAGQFADGIIFALSLLHLNML